MTNFEQPLSARDGFSSAPTSLPTPRSIKTAALLAVLIAYAIGFALLYPVAQASVAKSAAEGNDPTALEFVGP